MSQLTYTQICISYSDKIRFEIDDCNDHCVIWVKKNESNLLSLVLTHKQLDLLMDTAEDYLDECNSMDSVSEELKKFWGDV